MWNTGQYIKGYGCLREAGGYSTGGQRRLPGLQRHALTAWGVPIGLTLFSVWLLHVMIDTLAWLEESLKALVSE